MGAPNSQRKAFEKYIGGDCPPYDAENDCYHWTGVNDLWRCWQAAVASGGPLDEAGLYRASWELQRHFGREGSIYGIKACEEIARIALVAYQNAAPQDLSTPEQSGAVQPKRGPAESAPSEAGAERAPVAWRYRYGVDGHWRYVDTEDMCNDRPGYYHEPLYATSEGTDK